jgi:tetratricopeptide (TPR) repeat protein
MRKKLLLLLPLLFVLAIAAWAALRAARSQPEWTTESEAALAELRLGVAAERKLYHQDAQRHFARALALDPDCAAARLLLLSVERDPEKRKTRVAELATVDRAGLTPRETFLIDYLVAQGREQEKVADALLAAYLEGHPDDPHALNIRGVRLWNDRRYGEAEAIFTRLLELDPNLVTAQNNLGYLAMSQGRFALAEDRFRTYRYVAPDQANPHDSLGELMILQGRYEEARRELAEALRIRPDFCASYYNLVHIAALTRDFAAGREALAGAEQVGHCRPREVAEYRCRLRLWEQLDRGEYAALLAGYGGSCTDERPIAPWMAHLAAVMAGDLAGAERIEAMVRKQAAKAPPGGLDEAEPLLSHFAGVRLVAAGQPAEGARRLATVDPELDYFTTGSGVFKLFNRLQWANALALAGDQAGAARLLGEVAAVNPALAADYREGRLPFPGSRGATAPERAAAAER